MRAFILAVLAVALSVPSLAQGQAACGKRADIVKMLNDKYKEKPHALGIAGQTNLMEVYTSEAGSWSLLLTQPSGMTCIVGAGQSWEVIPVTLSGLNL